MTARKVDTAGDAWPITGHVCRGCSWPLAPYLPGQVWHPGCCPETLNLDGTPREATP